MLVRREVILAKVETTYNTDPTPSASTDAVLVEAPSWAFEGATLVERPAARPQLGALQSLYGGALKTVTFTAEVKGPGSAYSASVRPEIDALLRGCGFSVAVVTTSGSETCTYTPASTGLESITLYYYQDGTLHKITGARGKVEFNMAAGNSVKASFTFTGHFTAVTDATLATPTYDSTKPPIFVGATFAVASYAAITEKLDIDMGLTLAMPKSANASDGFGELRITDRKVTGSFDPEHVLVATHDFIGRFTAGTTGALTTGLIGATQYNKFTVSHPSVFYMETSPGDRSGIRTLSVKYGALESAGDDEISIAFA